MSLYYISAASQCTYCSFCITLYFSFFVKKYNLVPVTIFKDKIIINLVSCIHYLISLVDFFLLSSLFQYKAIAHVTKGGH